MPQTPLYALPSPLPGDPADGPGGFQNLANATENALERPLLVAARNAVQSIPNLTQTPILLQTVDTSVNAAGALTFNAATGQITVVRAATVVVDAGLGFDTNGTADCLLLVTTNTLELARVYSPRGWAATMSGTSCLRLAAGTMIWMSALHTAGVAINATYGRLSVAVLSF